VASAAPDIIDPAQKICIVLSHPSDKNKCVARVGHPYSVAIHNGRKRRSVLGDALDDDGFEDNGGLGLVLATAGN
jgi:hypothetical protein